MKNVTVTMKFEFETEEVDEEALKEAIALSFEEMVENDELLEKSKIKITDQDEEDESYEEDED